MDVSAPLGPRGRRQFVIGLPGAMRRIIKQPQISAT